MREHSVDGVELIYDPSVEQPKEDPGAIRERVEELAESEGFDLTVTDVAALDDDALQERYESLVGDLASRRYVVDRRVFGRNANMFGTHRPVLVTRDGESVLDVFPHRDERDSLVSITDALDEGLVTDPSAGSEADAAADAGSDGDEDPTGGSTDDDGIIAQLRGLIA